MSEGGNDRRVPLLIGLLAAAITIVAAKWNHPGLGNDATSYVAIADNLARHGRLGYFLEPQLALWPPGWPSVLAASEWAFGVTPQITALVVNAVTVVVISFEAWWLMRRMTSDRRVVIAGTAIAALGPATLSQSYMVQTEVTFVALVLGTFIALIRFSDTRRWIWIGLAAVLQWAAFMDRYVGIVSIGAGGLWLLIESGGDKAAERWRNGIAFVVAASLVPGAWLIRNIAVKGDLASAFGPRDTPLATYKSNVVDAATSVGQFIHGVSRYEPFTGVLRLVSLAVAGGCAVLAVVLLRRTLARKRAAVALAGGDTATVTWRDVLGHPAGLLLIYAAAHWAYMVYSASTIAFDPVNTRYLAPMFIPAMVVGLALLAAGGLKRAGADDRFTRLMLIGLVGLVVLQLVVGVVRASASYWDDAAQGYAAPQWLRTLDSPVFDSIPDDCEHLYSNFPEATYLAGIEAQRSPRIRRFASSDRMTELRQAERQVDRGETSCLVWISPDVLETPSYQHPLSALDQRFELEQVDGDRDVTVYVMNPAS